MKQYIFGVDLGGTTVKLGLFDTDGALLDKWEIPHGRKIPASISCPISPFPWIRRFSATASAVTRFWAPVLACRARF